MRLLILSILLIPFSLLSQEVKLGVPHMHTEEIYSIAYSPNGKTVVSASRDESAIIWHAESGKTIHVLHDPLTKSEMRSMRYSSSGKMVVTCGGSTAQIWDVESGKLLLRFVHRAEHDNYIMDGFFCRNDEWLVTISLDSYIRVWDVNTGELLRKIEGPGGITTASISPNEDLILVGYTTNECALWDLSSGELRYALQGHSHRINMVAFNTDGSLMVTASMDSTAAVWDVSSGQFQYSLLHSGWVKSVEFSSDGTTILTADGNACRVWSGNDGDLLLEINTEKVRPYLNSISYEFAQYSKDDSLIFTGSMGGMFLIWDALTGENRRVSRPCHGSLSGMAQNQEGDAILLSSAEMLTRVRLTPDYHTKFLGKWFAPVRSLSFDNSGQKLLTTSSSYQVLDFNTGKLQWSDKDWLPSLANFDPSGTKMVSHNNEGEGKLWNIETGNIEIEFSKRVVGNTTFNPDGNTMLIGHNEFAAIYDVSTGKKVHKLEGTNRLLNHARYNGDGTIIVGTCDFDSEVRVWDANSGKLLRKIKHEDWVWEVDISPDGKMIASDGYIDDKIFVWNDNPTVPMYTLEGHSGVVTWLEFSSDGKMLLSGSQDNTVRIWNLENGKLLHELSGHRQDVISAVFSPNNQHVVSSSEDGSLIIWDVKSGVQLLQQFGDSENWVHVHPSGLFDASPEAMQYMYWVKGTEVIQFDQLKEHYWVPGLWKMVMNGEKLPDVGQINKQNLPPDFQIEQAGNDYLNIHVSGKGQANYAKVWVNGKEETININDQLKDTARVVRYYYGDRPLKGGENNIEVALTNDNGQIESPRKFSEVIREKSTTPPQFFGVFIGVGHYQEERMNLQFSEKDALDMHKAIRIGAENLFKEHTYTYTLTSSENDRLTKGSIKRVFNEIDSLANPEDVVLVYLSGHGVTYGGHRGDFYYLTSDATSASSTSLSDSTTRLNMSISSSEFYNWLSSINAAHQVMIIDACGSGKAVENLAGGKGDFDEIQIKAIERLKDKTGTHIISGCVADASSYEASIYGQGLLTYSLLQAIKGAALGINNEVDISEMFNHAVKTVPDLAKGLDKVQKPQYAIPISGSISIGFLTDEDKKRIPLAEAKNVFVPAHLSEQYTGEFGNSSIYDESLTNELNQRLSIAATKDTNYVFINTSNYSNAWVISGTYEKTEDLYSFKPLSIRFGNDRPKQFKVEGTKEEILEELIRLVSELSATN